MACVRWPTRWWRAISSDASESALSPKLNRRRFLRAAGLALQTDGFSLSWTRSVAIVTSQSFPSSAFTRLSLVGRPDEVDAQARRLRDGRSSRDAVRDQARGLQPELGGNDREKLDEYFT